MDQSAHHVAIKMKMWIASLFLGLLLFVVFFLYMYAYADGFRPFVISASFAGSAAILFGLSFAMSGFAYYFDFLDPYVAYRKYLGLTGFWFAFVYSVLLLLSNPDKYWYGFFDNFLSGDVLLGLSAMAIFGLMALVSNNWAMRHLGVANWRRILRLGYFAYFLLVARAYVTEKTMWKRWFDDPSQGLPPPRILLSAFALAVIAFRGSMIISKWMKKKRDAQDTSSKKE